MEFSLAERCAKALGQVVSRECWILQRHTMDGGEWMKLHPCSHGSSCLPNPPRYGENNGIGWALTGPLIERFGLDVFRESKPDGSLNYWSCSEDAPMKPLTETRAADPCEAVAAWVATFVESGEAKRA